MTDITIKGIVKVHKTGRNALSTRNPNRLRNNRETGNAIMVETPAPAYADQFSCWRWSRVQYAAGLIVMASSTTPLSIRRFLYMAANAKLIASCARTGKSPRLEDGLRLWRALNATSQP